MKRFNLLVIVLCIVSISSADSAPPTPAPATRPTPPLIRGGKTDLNTATAAELEGLPGVGPAMAAKIIAGRPYAKIEDLSKAGIGEKTYRKFSEKVTVIVPPGTTIAPPALAENRPAATRPATAPTSKPSPASTKGKVWVNTVSGIYYKEGDRWYGRTKEGQFMTEDEAQKAGHRPPKNRAGVDAPK